MHRLFLILLALLFLPLSARADLASYLKKPEPKYSWKLKSKTEVLIGTVYEIDMISQEWQGIVWDHTIAIIIPKNVKPTSTMLLFNTGGTFKVTDAALALSLADKSKSPVAFLYGIPKQPLFDGLREDALISETFVRYLKSKDEDWPLLFPMVKSLIKAMDTVQAFAKEEWKFEVKSFLVSGASKRGWTSWLTGASGDPRVKAIAPLVIDMLNFSKQIPLQTASFGQPSEQIKDYTEKGLLNYAQNPLGQKLWAMVDPYSYRDKVTIPKMLIHGTNDPYWPQEATNMYWNDLQGDKYLLYVPNAGHNLQQKTDDNPRDLSRAVNSLAAYTRCIVYDKPMPKLNWEHKDGSKPGMYEVVVTSNVKPKAVRLWQVENATRDMRKSTWTESPINFSEGKSIGTVAAPQSGWKAFLAELEFEEEGNNFFLSTQLRMISAK
ncbi:hypothetical protein KIH39_01040 [Telmatocola sphagniphila]|uniref:PhoPQ-activated pathogenicity-related protein n=1 Tax=Telmatocola sphagniphila TaxID=1123043 RepID=A0A8E6B6U5_9BACT|nr:PhoPQ-activated protein PqaA family protein [Telmatocola sphagniphila]QVL32534.1 hypothetical protein KIH39_01040 [Telmatocola sphagniphila]